MEKTEVETNGTILANIKAEYTKNGGKDPSKADTKKLVDAWRAASAKVEAVEAQIAAAKVAESEAVLALAKAFGGKSLRIDGQVLDFASRGTTVFFRKKSNGVVDL